MKLLFSIIIILSSLYQNATIPFFEIEDSFAKKDAIALAKLGSDKIVISLFGKENIYSNAQSTQILKDFFKQHPLQNFKYVFKSKENQDGSFAIGNFSSKTETVRITFHFKKETTYKIVKMIIEKE